MVIYYPHVNPTPPYSAPASLLRGDATSSAPGAHTPLRLVPEGPLDSSCLSWNPRQVLVFLNSLGCDNGACEALYNAGTDGAALLGLTRADLFVLGVNPVAHDSILSALAVMRSTSAVTKEQYAYARAAVEADTAARKAAYEQGRWVEYMEAKKAGVASAPAAM